MNNNKLSEKEDLEKKESNKNQVSTWVKWEDITKIVLTIVAIIGAVIAYHQLKHISDISQADFILKFKESFFKKEAVQLMDEIDKKNIKYIMSKDSISQFTVKRNDTADIISAYDMDRILLNQFDNLGAFEKKGIISLDMVYNIFDWYVEECWENPEISKYILHERKHYGSHLYQNFEYIYSKCHEMYLKLNDAAIDKNK